MEKKRKPDFLSNELEALMSAVVTYCCILALYDDVSYTYFLFINNELIFYIYLQNYELLMWYDISKLSPL